MNNNKYQLGKIYTIRHPDTDKFYIGSTCQQYLSARLSGHRRHYNTHKKCSSKIILDLGIDDCYIELLENYPCLNKIELEKREGELIRSHKDNVVNKYIAGRTLHEWYVDNKERMLEKSKKNHLDNYIKVSDEEKNERALESKTRKSKWKKEKIQCECGSIICRSNKSDHEKTQKHTDYMQTI